MVAEGNHSSLTNSKLVFDYFLHQHNNMVLLPIKHEMYSICTINSWEN